MQNLIDRLRAFDANTSLAIWIGLGIVLFIVVVALAVWLIRLVRPTLNMTGGFSRSGRPQRLAVTDAFTLDREGRKLVIIRRDNVEHLILIGGPNDVVIEPNILRGERAPRARGEGAESSTPLELAANGDSPRAPAMPATPAAAAAPPPVPPRPMAPAPPLQPPRPASPSVPPPARPATPTPLASVTTAKPASQPAFDDEFEQALAAMQSKPVDKPAAAQAAPGTASPPARPAAPPADARPATAPPPAAKPAAAAPSKPAATLPEAKPAAPANAARPEPMSEMARRLNEVLQRPLSARPSQQAAKPPAAPTAPAAPPAPPTSPPSPPAAPPATPAAPPATSAAPPAASAPKPPAAEPPPAPPQPAATPAPAAVAIDELEAEMARLLGRTGQPKTPPP